MNVLGRFFLKSHNFGKMEFFVRCRRTYVLNNSYISFKCSLGPSVIMAENTPQNPSDFLPLRSPKFLSRTKSDSKYLTIKQFIRTNEESISVK